MINGHINPVSPFVFTGLASDEFDVDDVVVVPRVRLLNAQRGHRIDKDDRQRETA